MDQRRLWRTAVALAVLYFGFNFLDYGLFFASELIIWVAVYFVMAYMQRYGMRFVENRRANIWLILFGAIGSVGLLFVWEILGNHFRSLSGSMMHWNSSPTCSF